jgi:ABC-type multidrug transport system fused ATPase/permease subunit
MLLAAGIGVLQWIVARALRTRLRQLVISEFDMIANVSAYLQEVFQNVRVVKSFVAEKFEAMQLKANVGKLVPIHISRALYRHWQEPIVSMINALANIGILVLSARELLNGNLTIPGFFLFLFLGRAMIPPITELGQTYLGIEEMGASAQRLFQMINMRSSVADGPRKIDLFSKSIEFRDVSFGYGDERVLKNVTLPIVRGQMVAIVGPSGAGKSTLTDLLLRLYDPTEGEITIDDITLKELTIESYRRLFGVVGQENLLFNASIAENIAYGRKDISQEEIEAAARVANAAEFIEALPEGYQTFVGDRGIRLSGGQRQRIAIARALVHRPQILIMDEATSSLDTESERLVQSAIDAVVRETTAIVVAHRLSTVVYADKIVVLEKGHVLDQGKHAELYKRCDLYKKLCDLQFQVQRPTLPDLTANLEPEW